MHPDDTPLAEGIHLGIPAEQYHSDPCLEPSLSSSVAKILLNHSPRHAWESHPVLNPAYQPDKSNAMDYGTIAHELLLKRGAGMVVVEADDWRSKAAQEQRQIAREEGMTAVLRKDFARATAMMVAARNLLQDIPDCRNAFREPNLAEQVLVWRENGVWMRSMVDYIEPRRETGHIVVYDYKTTSVSASPQAVSAMLYAREYELQAAFITRGLETLIPDAQGMIVFRFVVQEVEPPFALCVVELDSAGQIIGRKKVAAAHALWKRSMETGSWPLYPARIIKAETPPYMEDRWLRRELNPDDPVSLENEIMHQDQDRQPTDEPMNPLLAG